MRILAAIALALVATLVVGCANSGRIESSLHDKTHQVRAPYVNVAVNLGTQHCRELWSLYDSLAAAGFRCGMRAMSLNAEPIVVEIADFDRAKAAVTEIIIRDKLTVRVYKSAEFGKSPAADLLEVWEKGQKSGEEPYKIYE